MENRKEIAMKGDNELAIGRNMDQGQGFVCYLFLEMACYRLKDSNVYTARPCFCNVGPYYLRAWHRAIL